MNLVNLQRASRPREAQYLHPRYLFFKRVLDVSLCLIFLLPALGLMAIVALIIVLDSPGSPIFIQERIGKDRRRFRLYKFRTMRCDYDPTGDCQFMQAFVAGQIGAGSPDNDAQFKPIKPQDITRVGRLLRKSSLDELPQLLNILKGEMSLIGPRPNVPWEVEAYRDWHYERLAVLPGITGLAQVHGRSNIPFDDIAQYDIDYVHNCCLKMDLIIIWQTIWTVLARSGAG